MITRLLVLSLAFLTAGAAAEEYRWHLPEGFAPPPVPADNPMLADKVELGRYLFYDRRMSVNGTQACGSCHIQKLAFTDGKPHAIGATGESHPRSSMSLVNVAWARTYTWANPDLRTLEEQMHGPMFGTHPVELGLDTAGAAFLRIVRADARYRELFPRAFPGESDPFSVGNIIKAIACFERSIVSARSPWDTDWRQIQHLYGLKQDVSVTSESARRGEFLFYSDRLKCARCHGGNNFDSTFTADRVLQPRELHNNGLPPGAPGLSEFTKVPEDTGKFKAPTMRNIELTAPYMHDGSLSTLEAVIDHYARGGNHVPGQSPLVAGFKLSQRDRADLIAFLRSLTDLEVTRDPQLSDPW